MTQMRADFVLSGASLSTVTSDYFFGYTQGMTMNAILEQGIANNDITRIGMLAAVPLVSNVDLELGGAAGGYGTTPQDRIPTLEDSVGLVTTTDQARFGLIRVGGFFSAPFLAGWIPS